MIATALAAAMLLIPAAAPDEPQYRNPAKPSKNPAELRDSGYRGFHYERKHEKFRKCVMARESGGNYKADSIYGSGAYQFVQKTWDMGAARAQMPEWVGVRPYLAPPTVQDEVFWVLANPMPKMKGLHGRHHWSSAHALTIGKRIKDC